MLQFVSLIRIHQINRQSVDSAIGRYTAFEQLGPGDIMVFFCLKRTINLSVI